MTTYNIPSVTINLENFPPSGSAGLSTKMRPQDRDLIYRAAILLGMKQADFIRIAMINAAREVVHQCEALEGV